MNPSRQATYRILDAAANRASEGMRTVEEYLRFGLDDVELAQQSKSLRHGLASALQRLDRGALLAARDTPGDVGTELQTDSEYRRQDLLAVITAAAQRVQQSLRVLEEYGKTVDTEFSRQIESIRYRSYTLYGHVEQFGLQTDRKRRLQNSVLYLLIDCLGDESAFIASIQQLADAGVDVFQLRDKSASDRMIYERAKVGTAVASRCDALFLVNDRADIAAAAGADGVHVGQDELPAAAARQIVGTDRLVGVSTHNLQQVHEAIHEGADYLGCGPTFPSKTKAFDSHAGLQFLCDVHRETTDTPRPAFAIGGIDHDNVADVTACGFHRIAVTAAIHSADDPAAAAKELKRCLNDSFRSPKPEPESVSNQRPESRRDDTHETR